MHIISNTLKQFSVQSNMSFLQDKLKSVGEMSFRFSPILQIVPNIQEALADAESPFDLLVDYVNFWANFTGVREIQIDKVKIFNHI